MATRPWKPPLGLVVRFLCDRLQLRHGDEAVETIEKVSTPASTLVAAMPIDVRYLAMNLSLPRNVS